MSQAAQTPVEAIAGEVETRTFMVSGQPYLTLENIRGTIDVQPGEPGQIVVTAVRHTDSGSAEATSIEMLQSEDGRVWVKTHYRAGGWAFLDFRRPCRVDYTARVPAECTLKLSGVSCSSGVRGLQGAIEIGSVSGALAVQDVSGSLKVNTVSGEVAGERLAGTLQLHTVSGSVRLQSSAFSSITASTVSGDMQFETSLTEGPYRFNSVSGTVVLLLPSLPPCSVHSHSVSGRVRGLAQVTQRREQGGDRRYEIAGGGVVIHHSSISGDLRLEGEFGSGPVTAPGPVPAAAAGSASGPAELSAAPTAEPAPSAAPTTPPLTRLEVLDRIAKGELSVEEALRLLT
jgi:hypothetical protein